MKVKVKLNTLRTTTEYFIWSETAFAPTTEPFQTFVFNLEKFYKKMENAAKKPGNAPGQLPGCGDRIPFTCNAEPYGLP